MEQNNTLLLLLRHTHRAEVVRMIDWLTDSTRDPKLMMQRAAPGLELTSQPPASGHLHLPADPFADDREDKHCDDEGKRHPVHERECAAIGSRKVAVEAAVRLEDHHHRNSEQDGKSSKGSIHQTGWARAPTLRPRQLIEVAHERVRKRRILSRRELAAGTEQRDYLVL